MRCVVIAAVVAVQLAPALLAQTTSHPLEPLTAGEITRTTEVLRGAGKLDSTSAFVSITVREPPKSEVLAWRPGTALRRESFAIIYDRAKRRTSEAVVDVSDGTLVSWKDIPGVQAPFLPSEYAELQRIVRADRSWQAAMRKRGIVAFDSIQIDPWSAGNFGLAGEQGKRLWRMLSYYKGSAENAYARPIEGVVAYVDIDQHKVMKLVDTGAIPVRKQPDDYDQRAAAAQQGGLRTAPKPLVINQPDGASFTLDGHDVRWQHWHFRFAVRPREGLVLYRVRYDDHGHERPILYRASLSEMVVPYGDPSATWFFRNAFDAGEYGLWGFLGSPLEPGIDAPSNATFVDAVISGEDGKPVTFPRAAAIYERDGGTLWKHVADESDGRRARDLVLALVTTVGNYEYGFHWIFHQDGTLEQEVELTGILQTKGLRDTTAATANAEHHATIVAPQLAAVFHQHFFNFRLDFDVDGPNNTVVEMNTVSDPAGASNPFANAFSETMTPLTTELQARRRMNLESNRMWAITNPNVRNALGEPTAYLLMPGSNTVPFAAPAASVRKRAGFLDAHVWVTPYAAAEMHAAGDYVNQSPGDDGLTRWTRANRAIANRDVVVWYTMGMTHIPRPEDWPMMAVQRVGFKLVPAGFFTRDPALDLPKDPAITAAGHPKP